MLNLFYTLKNAYEVSTHNANHFLEAINSINWDNKFYADNEYYFIKDEMTFTTTSLNPFEVDWSPEALFADGTLLTL